MKILIMGIVGLILGTWLGYTIQFEWHFFGASMMRFQDILQVWLACLVIPTVFGVLIGAAWER